MTHALSGQERWIKLETLSQDLQVFNPDRIALINTYLARTGIKTHIIAIFAQMREDLRFDCSQQFSSEYSFYKKEMISILKRRVTFLQNPCEMPTLSNVWLEVAKKQKASSDFSQLEILGSTWEDLLFECAVIIKAKYEKAVNVCIQDLNEFANRHSIEAINSLSEFGNDVVAQKQLKQINKEFSARLEQLVEVLKKRDFESAQSHFDCLSAITSSNSSC